MGLGGGDSWHERLITFHFVLPWAVLGSVWRGWSVTVGDTHTWLPSLDCKVRLWPLLFCPPPAQGAQSFEVSGSSKDQLKECENITKSS